MNHDASEALLGEPKENGRKPAKKAVVKVIVHEILVPEVTILFFQHFKNCERFKG